MTSKWNNECERKYALFLYDGYKYKETEFDDTFLRENFTVFNFRLYMEI